MAQCLRGQLYFHNAIFIGHCFQCLFTFVNTIASADGNSRSRSSVVSSQGNSCIAAFRGSYRSYRAKVRSESSKRRAATVETNAPCQTPVRAFRRRGRQQCGRCRRISLRFVEFKNSRKQDLPIAQKERRIVPACLESFRKKTSEIRADSGWCQEKVTAPIVEKRAPCHEYRIIEWAHDRGES